MRDTPSRNLMSFPNEVARGTDALRASFGGNDAHWARMVFVFLPSSHQVDLLQSLSIVRGASLIDIRQNTFKRSLERSEWAQLALGVGCNGITALKLVG